MGLYYSVAVTAFGTDLILCVWKSKLTPEDPFFPLRDRAYALADTGKYRRWDDVAFALKAEGFDVALITRLNYDKLAVMMISRCCAKARGAAI